MLVKYNLLQNNLFAVYKIHKYIVQYIKILQMCITMIYNNTVRFIFMYYTSKPCVYFRKMENAFFLKKF